MLNEIQNFWTNLGFHPEYVLVVGIAMGALVMIVGIRGILSPQDVTARRMNAAHLAPHKERQSILRLEDNDPKGILRLLVPTAAKERTDISQKLRRAGIQGTNATRNYFVIRSTLAFLLPAAFVALIFAPGKFGLYHPLLTSLSQMTVLTTIQVLAGLTLLGFFGPNVWLRNRIKNRKTEIERSLPNALDLLQVAVEAGLGFDAAMTRVAHEMAKSAPAIADEFTFVQLELQAGKQRDRAFYDLAKRCGVKEVSSFANVVLQSAQFGTSISEALAVYSAEMRNDRELRANEMANKLPVKMSAVMAALMMPVLLMICLAPVVIRWIRIM